jgi:hypothetical protein
MSETFRKYTHTCGISCVLTNYLQNVAFVRLHYTYKSSAKLMQQDAEIQLNAGFFSLLHSLQTDSRARLASYPIGKASVT